MRRHLFVAASVLVALSIGAKWVSAADTELKNLLPNASFELDFGDGLQTHWADYQNALTLKLTATGQLPKTYPARAEQKDVPDGSHAVRLAVQPVAAGHLPSPVLEVKPGQAYTLSVYARSDEPSAAIKLTLWTRAMDFGAAPDVASAAMRLSKEWKRYELTFVGRRA